MRTCFCLMYGKNVESRKPDPGDFPSLAKHFCTLCLNIRD